MNHNANASQLTRFWFVFFFGFFYKIRFASIKSMQKSIAWSIFTVLIS